MMAGLFHSPAGGYDPLHGLAGNQAPSTGVQGTPFAAKDIVLFVETAVGGWDASTGANVKREHGPSHAKKRSPRGPI